MLSRLSGLVSSKGLLSRVHFYVLFELREKAIGFSTVRANVRSFGSRSQVPLDDLGLGATLSLKTGLAAPQLNDQGLLNLSLSHYVNQLSLEFFIQNGM